MQYKRNRTFIAQTYHYFAFHHHFWDNYFLFKFIHPFHESWKSFISTTGKSRCEKAFSLWLFAWDFLTVHSIKLNGNRTKDSELTSQGCTRRKSSRRAHKEGTERDRESGQFCAQELSFQGKLSDQPNFHASFSSRKVLNAQVQITQPDYCRSFRIFKIKTQRIRRKSRASAIKRRRQWKKKKSRGHEVPPNLLGVKLLRLRARPWLARHEARVRRLRQPTNLPVSVCMCVLVIFLLDFSRNRSSLIFFFSYLDFNCCCRRWAARLYWN